MLLCNSAQWYWIFTFSFPLLLSPPHSHLPLHPPHPLARLSSPCQSAFSCSVPGKTYWCIIHSFLTGAEGEITSHHIMAGCEWFWSVCVSVCLSTDSSHLWPLVRDAHSRSRLMQAPSSVCACVFVYMFVCVWYRQTVWSVCRCSPDRSFKMISY